MTEPSAENLAWRVACTYSQISPLVAYQMSFVEFITNVDRVSDLFITGLWLSYIRIKTNSLYGAILPHWMSDLAYDIVTHV